MAQSHTPNALARVTGPWAEDELTREDEEAAETHVDLAAEMAATVLRMNDETCSWCGAGRWMDRSLGVETYDVLIEKEGERLISVSERNSFGSSH